MGNLTRSFSARGEWNGKSLPEKLTTTEFLIVSELAKRPGV